MRKIKTAPLIPTKFEIDEVSSREINIRISPFEVGFAITFAHPLKRLLMSSSIGYAPIAIKVENASHEFDNLSGMLEDISELIINLKSIRFKLKDGVEKAEVSYSFTGSKEIYGSDLENEQVEIVTPKNFLATLNEDGELNFTLSIYKGIGYVPSEDIRSSVLKDDTEFIPLDAYFTPIQKATYEIENILVEDNPNFEEIIFHIMTDGQASPTDVFTNALQVMENQLSIFKTIYSDGSEVVPNNDSLYGSDSIDDIALLSEEEEVSLKQLLVEIKDFGLKPRVANALISAEFRFVGDVAFFEDKELKEIKNFGAGSITDLKTALEKNNLDKDSLSFLSDKAKAEFRKRSEQLNTKE